MSVPAPQQYKRSSYAAPTNTVPRRQWPRMSRVRAAPCASRQTGTTSTRRLFPLCGPHAPVLIRHPLAPPIHVLPHALALCCRCDEGCQGHAATRVAFRGVLEANQRATVRHRTRLCVEQVHPILANPDPVLVDEVVAVAACAQTRGVNNREAKAKSRRSAFLAPTARRRSSQTSREHVLCNHVVGI